MGLNSYSGFSLGIAIVATILFLLFLMCSRSKIYCLVMGPWFNFIIFLRAVFTLIASFAFSKLNTMKSSQSSLTYFVIGEIIVYILVSRLWRYQTRKLLRA